MTNELLLIGSLIFEFSAVLVAYRLFGKNGLYAMTVFCTIASNIEVMILVHAFGIDQTLGNILFASSFVITDILSENEGKKSANLAVNLGIFISALFIVISQSWLLYIPAPDDTVASAVHIVFSNTPRIMIASFITYAVTQKFDVWMYHKCWSYTNKKFGDSTKYLWLRNCASTLISQFLNTLLFTFGAFWGTYPSDVLLSILVSSYLIFIVTSICDTPVVYIARRIKKNTQI